MMSVYIYIYILNETTFFGNTNKEKPTEKEKYIPTREFRSEEENTCPLKIKLHFV